ncbi:MAG TPA: DUF5666 domain-containing protein [Thermoanaerobaculia bacterium]|nr:DUF5666 domain-containing protein [Thermoanaerobaculia bacterium]
MKIIRMTSFSIAIVTAALLTGCGSSGIDILGGGNGTGTSTGSGTYAANDVQGTVESVNTRDRYIVVDNETTYRSNLRNDNDTYGDEVTVYYDDSTRVEYGGRTYRPEDLERGDRIRADVEQSGSRLLAEQIEVLRDSTSSSSSGSSSSADLNNEELRGTVRYLDTRNQTLEIEPSQYSSNFSTGRSGDVVVVHYDTQTIVEFQGQRYSPENLERGDTVEVELRELGGRLLAQEILVVSDARSGR